MPAEIKNGQAYLSSIAHEGATLMNQLKSIQEQIALKKSDDSYYNASFDEENLKKTFHDSLDSPEKIKAHLDSIRVGERTQDYDRGKIVADYVKGVGKKVTEYDNTTDSGLKTTNYKSNQFINDKGVPEITDDHVNDLLKKHPIMYKTYAEEANDQILNEIKIARAADEQWARGKSDEDLFSDIYHGNSGNPNTPTVEAKDDNGNTIRDEKGKIVKVPISFGTRINELAKRDISQYEDTHIKSSIDASNYQAGSRYGITSKAYNPPADGFKQGDLSGPSRMLVKKTGTGDNRFLYIPASQAEWRYDNDTGKYVKTGVNSSIPFVMTSYQWGPVDADGKPVVLKANSTEDLLRIINDPKTIFGPNGITGARPIISGRAIDKASVLNLAYNGGKLKGLEDEVLRNPDDKNLKNDLTGLHEALDNIQADRSFDSQLIQKYIGADVIKNQSFATTPEDPNVQAIQGDTQMNIYNPKSLNNDMRLVKDAIEKRVKEASQHFDKKGPDMSLSKATTTTKPDESAEMTPERFASEWSNLKSGQTLVGPDGKTYTKK